MTHITQTTVSALTVVSGSHIATAAINALHRESGVHMTSGNVTVLHRQLLPSVRIASIYFNTDISMRAVFNKTGATSLMELVNSENSRA